MQLELQKQIHRKFQMGELLHFSGHGSTCDFYKKNNPTTVVFVKVHYFMFYREPRLASACVAE